MQLDVLGRRTSRRTLYIIGGQYVPGKSRIPRAHFTTPKPQVVWPMGASVTRAVHLVHFAVRLRPNFAVENREKPARCVLKPDRHLFIKSSSAVRTRPTPVPAAGDQVLLVAGPWPLCVWGPLESICSILFLLLTTDS